MEPGYQCSGLPVPDISSQTDFVDALTYPPDNMPRLEHRRVDSVGSETLSYGTHSMQRTKVTQIYRKPGNLRAVQLLLRHTKLESSVRYLGIEVVDALHIAEQIELWSSNPTYPGGDLSLEVDCFPTPSPHFSPIGCFFLASLPQSAKFKSVLKDRMTPRELIAFVGALASVRRNQEKSAGSRHRPKGGHHHARWRTVFAPAKATLSPNRPDHLFKR